MIEQLQTKVNSTMLDVQNRLNQNANQFRVQINSMMQKPTFKKVLTNIVNRIRYM